MTKSLLMLYGLTVVMALLFSSVQSQTVHLNQEDDVDLPEVVAQILEEDDEPMPEPGQEGGLELLNLLRTQQITVQQLELIIQQRAQDFEQVWGSNLYYQHYKALFGDIVINVIAEDEELQTLIQGQEQLRKANLDEALAFIDQRFPDQIDEEEFRSMYSEMLPADSGVFALSRELAKFSTGSVIAYEIAKLENDQEGIKRALMEAYQRRLLIKNINREIYGENYIFSMIDHELNSRFYEAFNDRVMTEENDMRLASGDFMVEEILQEATEEENQEEEQEQSSVEEEEDETVSLAVQLETVVGTNITRFYFLTHPEALEKVEEFNMRRQELRKLAESDFEGQEGEQSSEMETQPELDRCYNPNQEILPLRAIIEARLKLVEEFNQLLNPEAEVNIVDVRDKAKVGIEALTEYSELLDLSNSILRDLVQFAQDFTSLRMYELFKFYGLDIYEGEVATCEEEGPENVITLDSDNIFIGANKFEWEDLQQYIDNVPYSSQVEGRLYELYAQAFGVPELIQQLSDISDEEWQEFLELLGMSEDELLDSLRDSGIERYVTLESSSDQDENIMVCSHTLWISRGNGKVKLIIA